MEIRTSLAAAALTSAAMVAGAGVASAAVSIGVGPTPTAAFMNPTATATTGAVYENVVGSVPGLRTSPWVGSAVDPDEADSYYTSVSGGASATYSFGGNRTALSFLWGTPDTYNDLEITLAGGTGTASLSGSDLAAANGDSDETVFVTISGITFDEVTFSSGSNAFEYANLAAVPLPAAGLVMLTALGGAAAAYRRRKA